MVWKRDGLLYKEEIFSIMSPKLTILQGGEDVKKRSCHKMFEDLVSKNGVRRMLIIPWTTASEEKEKEYRDVLYHYFKDVGFSEIRFLERDDTEMMIEEKFANSDVLYLPGGDPSILLKEVNTRLIGGRIATFKGIIIGNSAGAIVLSSGGFADGIFYDGMGLLNVKVEVHSKLDSVPTNASKDTIVGIPEDGWILVRAS